MDKVFFLESYLKNILFSMIRINKNLFYCQPFHLNTGTLYFEWRAHIGSNVLNRQV